MFIIDLYECIMKLKHHKGVHYNVLMSFNVLFYVFSMSKRRIQVQPAPDCHSDDNPIMEKIQKLDERMTTKEDELKGLCNLCYIFHGYRGDLYFRKMQLVWKASCSTHEKEVLL